MCFQDTAIFIDPNLRYGLANPRVTIRTHRPIGKSWRRRVVHHQCYVYGKTCSVLCPAKWLMASLSNLHNQMLSLYVHEFIVYGAILKIFELF